MRRYRGVGILAALLVSGRAVLGAGFAISGGTVTLVDQAQLSTIGDLVINSGSLVAHKSNIVVGGNWTNLGTFTAGNSTITFNGTSGQVVNNSSQTFSVLYDSNTSAA